MKNSKYKLYISEDAFGTISKRISELNREGRLGIGNAKSTGLDFIVDKEIKLIKENLGLLKCLTKAYTLDKDFEDTKFLFKCSKKQLQILADIVTWIQIADGGMTPLLMNIEYSLNNKK
jgi:hypothetical protein